MLWLQRHRLAIVIGLGLVISLPAMVRALRADAACIREAGADWQRRLLMFVGFRACPSGEP